MEFVYEQDDLPLCLGNLLQHGLEPLLEFAPIFRSRDKRSEIERHDALLFEAFGHIAGYDASGQALDNSSLAHPRLADQHGVILGAAREHLNTTPDFRVPANNRVELVLRGQSGQVASVLFERFVGGFGICARYALIATDFGQRLQEFLAPNVESLENFSD